MLKAKRSLVVSSLLVAVGVGYVGFGHPTPMGAPQANVYGHHDESRSAEREERTRDHHSNSSHPRWSSDTRRPSFGRPNARQEKRDESEVSTSDSREKESASTSRVESRERSHSQSRESRRPGGSSWPGSRPASYTPPPAWYKSPEQPQLGGEPGILMPEPIRVKLKLDAAQHRELDQIQQELDERLQAVLTPEQFAKLEKLREEFLDQELGPR